MPVVETSPARISALASSSVTSPPAFNAPSVPMRLALARESAPPMLPLSPPTFSVPPAASLTAPVLVRVSVPVVETSPARLRASMSFSATLPPAASEPSVPMLLPVPPSRIAPLALPERVEAASAPVLAWLIAPLLALRFREVASTVPPSARLVPLKRASVPESVPLWLSVPELVRSSAFVAETSPPKVSPAALSVTSPPATLPVCASAILSATESVPPAVKPARVEMLFSALVSSASPVTPLPEVRKGASSKAVLASVTPAVLERSSVPELVIWPFSVSRSEARVMSVPVNVPVCSSGVWFSRSNAPPAVKPARVEMVFSVLFKTPPPPRLPVRLVTEMPPSVPSVAVPPASRISSVPEIRLLISMTLLVPVSARVMVLPVSGASTSSVPAALMSSAPDTSMLALIVRSWPEVSSSVLASKLLMALATESSFVASRMTVPCRSRRSSGST